MTTDEMQRQVLDALKRGKIKPDKVIMGDLVEGDGMTLQDQIKIDYAEYCDEFKMLPNYVEVDVRFDDGDISYSEIIALHEYDADVDPDDAIFFYCHGLKDLCELCEVTNGGDFVIVSCSGFSDKI